jgi:hypothetical protein
MSKLDMKATREKPPKAAPFYWAFVLTFLAGSAFWAHCRTSIRRATLGNSPAPPLNPSPPVIFPAILVTP